MPCCWNVKQICLFKSFGSCFWGSFLDAQNFVFFSLEFTFLFFCLYAALFNNFGAFQLNLPLFLWFITWLLLFNCWSVYGSGTWAARFIILNEQLRDPLNISWLLLTHICRSGKWAKISRPSSVVGHCQPKLLLFRVYVIFLRYNCLRIINRHWASFFEFANWVLQLIYLDALGGVNFGMERSLRVFKGIFVGGGRCRTAITQIPFSALSTPILNLSQNKVRLGLWEIFGSLLYKLCFLEIIIVLFKHVDCFRCFFFQMSQIYPHRR